MKILDLSVFFNEKNPPSMSGFEHKIMESGRDDKPDKIILTKEAYIEITDRYNQIEEYLKRPEITIKEFLKKTFNGYDPEIEIVDE